MKLLNACKLFWLDKLKNEKKKLYSAIILTLFAALICVGFVFRSELCYFASPSYYVCYLADSTADKLQEETGYISKKLLGFDATEQDYTLSLRSNAYIDQSNQSLVLSVSPGKEDAIALLETTVNNTPITQTVLVWNDESIRLFCPEMDNNCYTLPTKSFNTALNNSALGKSLNANIPNSVTDIAYSRIVNKEKLTESSKTFLQNIRYYERKKENILLDGTTQTLYTIEASCDAKEFGHYLQTVFELYADPFHTNTVPLPEYIKAYNRSNAKYNFKLLEKNRRLIGIQTDTFTFYFHSGLFLNGFVYETETHTITMRGDIQMQGGIMDFTIYKTSPGASETPEDKLLGVYFDRSVKTVSIYTPYASFAFHMRCATEEEPFAIYKDLVYKNGVFLDYALEITAGRPEITLPEKEVSLLPKPSSYWMQLAEENWLPFLKRTRVLDALSN